MSIVKRSAALEAWLSSAADEWIALLDSDYQQLVERWRTSFGVALEHERAIQGPNALSQLEAKLPATVFLFNGVKVARASTGVTGHPQAYRAVALRSFERGLANEFDRIVTDEALSFCCVCTHEWQTLAHPIFVERAA